jgi:hypothetical protein
MAGEVECVAGTLMNDIRNVRARMATEVKVKQHTNHSHIIERAKCGLPFIILGKG